MLPRKKNRPRRSRLWTSRLLYWLKAAPGVLREAGASRRYSKLLRRSSLPLKPSAEASAQLSQAWQALLVKPAGPGGGSAAHPCAAAPSPVFSAGELALIRTIRKQTCEANRNNITRTAAYLAFYNLHPDIHWAFLAHMVSRNGGWSMTDLSGDIMPRLLSLDERRHIFEFLERSNALIFHDAYPQLLLYRESRLAGKPLFHLLPLLGVSRFMLPVWERFWRKPEPAPLTICLIMNEQHYIEGRVVQNAFFRRQVLSKPAFRLQPALQETQVVFPYRRIKQDEPSGRQLWRLTGVILESFSDLQERIEVGKTLYAMLFGNPIINNGVHAFAAAHSHTGSRADYHPALFAAHQKASPQQVGAAERLDGDGIRPGAERLDGYAIRSGVPPFYSPQLEEAWADQPFEAPGGSDWFADMKQLRPFGSAKAPRALDITGEACLGLYKLELAVFLKPGAAQALGDAQALTNAQAQDDVRPVSPPDGPASPESSGSPEEDHLHSPGYIPGLPSAAADTEEPQPHR